MNVRSKILKIRNLPSDGVKVGHISAKPYLFIGVCILIGCFLLCTRFYLVGIIITMLFLYYLLFVKDAVLVDVYEQYAVFYLNNGKDECYLLFWEDVQSWQVAAKRNELDELHIVLKNQQCVTLKCLGRKKIVHWFQEYAGAEKKAFEEFPKQHA